jgi:hypothetical protein
MARTTLRYLLRAALMNVLPQVGAPRQRTIGGHHLAYPICVAFDGHGVPPLSWIVPYVVVSPERLGAGLAPSGQAPRPVRGAVSCPAWRLDLGQPRRASWQAPSAGVRLMGK